MTQKPKSLKDLKKKNPKANDAQISGKEMHSAIGSAKGNRTKGLIGGLGTAVALLLISAFFYIYSQGMTVKISPDEAAFSGYVTLESGAGWVSDGGQIYVLGSNYRISVHAKDFTSQVIDITPATAISFLEVMLRPKPASISIATDPVQDGTKWILNNKLVSTRADFQKELEPGEYQLGIDHPHFEPVIRPLTLERAQEMTLTVPLSRIQGQINLRSMPVNASVTIDGGPPIMLPYAGLLAGGKHVIQIQAPGYMPISDQVDMINTQKLIQRNYRLRPMQSGVMITAKPDFAQITLDGRSVNNGSVTTINANQNYHIDVSQKGYNSEKRTVRVSPGQTQELDFRLKPAMGQVNFIAKPRAADVLINGENRGKAPLTLKLQALPTRVEFTRPGYRTSTTTITPAANRPTTISLTLRTELDARLRELPPYMTDSAGVELLRFKPDQKSFFIGAPRSEIGQLANEILRQVQLTKYFYAGKYEITVGQFLKFQPNFGGGQGKNMPVTGVTWTQAAQFSNWLSQKENLTAFYQINHNQVVGYNIYADGYRLPSEAEWEWLARKSRRPELTKYTWGNKKVITSSSGNLADESAKGSVPTYIARYDDKYALIAPIGSFPAERSGLHDMSGNVREWVNDRYSLAVPMKGKVAVNSFGPSIGEGNVVKGSGFRSASLTDLRAARRHQEPSASNDIGFRVVRYVYGAEDR
ncbi:hypothetical protein MNBD_ALPHA03-76 [hydrothermal vent metagenome]|uniref:Serine/threonine kinase n=1 Tax=hydrothermal vent metagenome TaxID=652676 RepID=A0A3B1BRK7_9ZZZZ